METVPRRKQLEKILRLASLALLVLPATSFSLLHCGGAQALGRGLPRRQCADFINRSSIRDSKPRPARKEHRLSPSTSMVFDSAAHVLGAGLLVGGVDSLFRLSLRGPAPAGAAVALSQLAVSVALLAKGFTVVTSAAFAVVAAALFQGIDKSAAGDCRDFFQGKTVWITGASSGIGEALAYACHSAGARVILSARRLSELERVRDACLALAPATDAVAPPRPVIVQLDLSCPADMPAAVAKVQTEMKGEGQIDVLVHNGGVSTRALAEDMAWEVDESVFKVNYFGPVALTKAVLPGMLERKAGHIVAISSVQGIIGLPARSAYSASKHALHGFFDGLRAELASRKVAVSIICPGYVRTSLSLNAVVADGAKYGQMDETTAKGMPPEKFAALALDAIARKEAQVVIADDVSAHVGVYLKWLCPHVLEWVMRKRAKKALADK